MRKFGERAFAVATAPAVGRVGRGEERKRPGRVSDKDLVWSGHDAGTDLNRLTGQDFYVRSGTGDFRQPLGDFEEAARRYREWMAEHSGTLEFDERATRWRVD